MFKNIFLPTSINNYYLFGYRIIGLDIRKTRIIGTQIYIAGKNVKIEKIIEEKTSLSENLETYINNVLTKLDKPNEIRTALPNSLAIFKEINLPFIDQTKIAMVLPFEIESALPFSLKDAVLDFIIINQDKTNKNSHIAATISQKKHIQYLQNLVDNLGFKTTNISVDIIAIYSLLKSNQIINANSILIDLSFAATTIAIIESGNLSEVRTINKGLSALINNIAKLQGINDSEALQQLERFGLQKFSTQINEYSQTISNDILFTMSSFKNFNANKAIIINSDIELDLTDLFGKNLKIQTELFDINLILNKKINKEMGVNLHNQNLTSIAIAVPNEIDSNFNLLKDYSARDQKLLQSQLITAIILFVFIIGSLIIFYIFRSKKLNSELNNSKIELVSIIKKTFDITDPSLLKNPTKLVDSIRNKVNEEESLWFAFSKKTRFSFLKYLQELSEIIDTKKIGLKLNKLSITDGSILMSGSVPDFPALNELEESLNKSELFSKITPPQETEFNITLTLKRGEM